MKTHPREWATTKGRPQSIAADILDAQIAHLLKHKAPMSLATISVTVGAHEVTVRKSAIRLTTHGYLEQRPGSTLYWPVVDADGNSVTGEKL